VAEPQHALRRRLLLYVPATAAAAVLVWAGFVRVVEPDPWTQLGSVEIQLRLAAGMPERDKQGQPLEARATLLADARARLASTLRELPQEAQVWEYRGFLAWLERDYVAAARDYATARGFATDAVLRENLLQNEARMLSLSDRADDAIRLLAGEGGATVARGQLAELIGTGDGAARIYEAARAREPVADYFLGRLKLRAGSAERAADHVERGLRTSGDQVRELLRSERAAWEPGVGADRLARWLVANEVTPAPGR
jgi:hypothetical protein